MSSVADAAPSPSHLLQHFEKPGVPLPPSARVGDPKLKQRERQPLTLWQLSKLAAFGAAKGEFTFIHKLVCQLVVTAQEIPAEYCPCQLLSSLPNLYTITSGDLGENHGRLR